MSSELFKTERLICRPFRMEDAEDMLEYWASDPDIQLEYGEPVYTDIQQVRVLLNDYISGIKSKYRWAVVEKTSGRNIGQIAFCKVWEDCRTAEIEYCIGKHFWGNGYAGEVLSALIRYAFENTDFERLEAYHRAENTKSGRVLEKSVMNKTDTVQRFVREEKAPSGEVCYFIEKHEYNIK